MTEKENKKINEQEDEVENDGGNQKYFEMEQQAKYCMYLISTFKTKKENKGFLRKSAIVGILVAIFLIGVALVINVKTNLSPEIKDVVLNVIYTIEIPLVLFILTDSISSVRNIKIENENRINEFIKTAMPLYNTQWFLANVDYKDIVKYYLYFTNPNDDECKNLIPEKERPDVL